jgi:transposase-like protein
MARRRTREEIEQIVQQYEASGMTQAEYCRQAGVSLSSLQRYMQKRDNGQRMVRVRLQPAPERSGRFALVLANGRRIESDWQFDESDLARLIRVAETM